MKHLKKLARKRLGDILIDEGLISKSQLADMERERNRHAQPLGALLVKYDLIDEYDLAKVVTSQYQLPYVDLTTVGGNKATHEIFTAAELYSQRMIPLDVFGTVLTLVVSEMPDLDFLEKIQDRTELTPYLFVGLLSDIERHLKEIGAWGAVAEVDEEEEEEEKKIPQFEIDAEEMTSADTLAVLDKILPGNDGAGGHAPNDDWRNIFNAGEQSVQSDKR
jgi:type IV pilus assembly protein PilB